MNISAVCLAMDEGGCLTCHQYPGLVTMKKHDEVKVLHIDEETYLKSPHGRVDCRKCHTQVKKIPHTGETGVDCTTECHIEDKEKIEALDLSLLTIHKGEKFAIASLRSESSCRICHFLYPHSKNNLVRAYINMHAGFMFCEVCHIKKEYMKDVTYEWDYHESVEFTFEPYGNYKRHKIGIIQRIKNVLSRIFMIFFPEKSPPWKIRDAVYSLSRIAAFSVKNGKKTIFMDTWDNQKAIEFKGLEESLNPAEKEEGLRHFHRDTAKKEISVACDECHSLNRILLDYRKLGFDEIKTNKLRRLNIKGLVTKYSTFYFPKLLYTH